MCSTGCLPNGRSALCRSKVTSNDKQKLDHRNLSLHMDSNVYPIEFSVFDCSIGCSMLVITSCTLPIHGMINASEVSYSISSLTPKSWYNGVHIILIVKVRKFS